MILGDKALIEFSENPGFCPGDPVTKFCDSDRDGADGATGLARTRDEWALNCFAERQLFTASLLEEVIVCPLDRFASLAPGARVADSAH